MKSIVKLASVSASVAAFPSIDLGDKGNIWLRDTDTSGVVIGTVEGASKPKPVGYRSDRLVPDKFEKLPAGTEITIAI